MYSIKSFNFNRYLTVKFPQIGAVWCRIERARLAIVLVVITTTLAGFPNFLVTIVKQQEMNVEIDFNNTELINETTRMTKDDTLIKDYREKKESETNVDNIVINSIESQFKKLTSEDLYLRQNDYHPKKKVSKRSVVTNPYKRSIVSISLCLLRQLIKLPYTTTSNKNPFFVDGYHNSYRPNDYNSSVFHVDGFPFIKNHRRNFSFITMNQNRLVKIYGKKRVKMLLGLTKIDNYFSKAEYDKSLKLLKMLKAIPYSLTRSLLKKLLCKKSINNLTKKIKKDKNFALNRIDTGNEHNDVKGLATFTKKQKRDLIIKYENNFQKNIEKKNNSFQQKTKTISNLNKTKIVNKFNGNNNDTIAHIKDRNVSVVWWEVDMDSSQTDMVFLNFWLMSFFFRLIPCCLLCILSLLLIRTMHQADIKRSRLLNKPSKSPTQHNADDTTQKTGRKNYCKLLRKKKKNQSLIDSPKGIENKDLIKKNNQSFDRPSSNSALLNKPKKPIFNPSALPSQTFEFTNIPAPPTSKYGFESSQACYLIDSKPDLLNDRLQNIGNDKKNLQNSKFNLPSNDIKINHESIDKGLDGNVDDGVGQKQSDAAFQKAVLLKSRSFNCFHFIYMKDIKNSKEYIESCFSGGLFNTTYKTVPIRDLSLNYKQESSTKIQSRTNKIGSFNKPISLNQYLRRKSKSLNNNFGKNHGGQFQQNDVSDKVCVSNEKLRFENLHTSYVEKSNSIHEEDCKKNLFKNHFLNELSYNTPLSISNGQKNVDPKERRNIFNKIKLFEPDCTELNSENLLLNFCTLKKFKFRSELNIKEFSKIYGNGSTNCNSFDQRISNAVANNKKNSEPEIFPLFPLDCLTAPNESPRHLIYSNQKLPINHDVASAKFFWHLENFKIDEFIKSAKNEKFSEPNEPCSIYSNDLSKAPSIQPRREPSKKVTVAKLEDQNPKPTKIAFTDTDNRRSTVFRAQRRPSTNRKTNRATRMLVAVVVLALVADVPQGISMLLSGFSEDFKEVGKFIGFCDFSMNLFFLAQVNDEKKEDVNKVEFI